MEKLRNAELYALCCWPNVIRNLKSRLWDRYLRQQGAWLQAGRRGFVPGCRRGGDFSSLLRVQIGPGVHLASSKMSTGAFPGVNAAEHRTAQLILQPFHHFTYVITHSPTLPSLYLRHSSFSNPSVASHTSQLILQPFFRFSYVTWRAAHVKMKM